GGRDPFGPAQVLDRDRNSVQLREDLALADHLLGGPRLRERELGRDERVRLQRGIDPLDPAQHRLGDLDRRDLARGDQARELFDREVVEVVEHHATLRAVPEARSSHTARVTSAVVAWPPRSRVCSAGFAVTRSIAPITRPAASLSPRCSSSITTDQNVPIGLASPLPMMSNAEPWIGSNIEGKRRSGSMLAVGAMPRLPASAAARSLRMSACRFVATIVSSDAGRLIIRAVEASTSSLSQATSGNSFAT